MSARDGNPEIYSVNADGTELTRLTDDSSNDEHPAWSPDGKRIAFLSDRGGDHLWYDVYVVDADGSNIQRMTSSRRAWQDPSWSPDGKSITFSSSSDGSSNLWQVPATGGTPTLQFSSPGYDGEPSWSPDGTRLAFDSDYFLYDFGTDIFLVNANGSGFRVLTDGVTSDSIAYTHPSWSPDGSRLALRVNRDLYAAGYITWVGVMNADGSGLTLLTSPKKSVQEVFEFGATTWSPDGTTIAYTSCDEAGCNVAWVRADGSAQGTLINGGWNPSWQP